MSFRRLALPLSATALSLSISSAFAQGPAPAPTLETSAPPGPVMVAVPAETRPAPLAPSDDFARAGSFALSFNHGFVVSESEIVDGANEIQGSYFVSTGLSMGLAVGAAYVSQAPPDGNGTSSALFLHVSPRVGYDLRLGDHFSLWPQVGIDYRRRSQSAPSDYPVPAGSSPAISDETSTTNAWGLSVLAPVLLHPTRGLFVGAGPMGYTDFSRSQTRGSVDLPRVTSIGLVGMLGGSF